MSKKFNYTVKTVSITKEMKINLGNYETAGLVIGMDVVPDIAILTEDDLQAFSDGVSKDINNILAPQVKAIKEYAKTRYKEK